MLFGASLVAPQARADTGAPMRPAGAPLRYADGVLNSWGVGNRRGGIVVVVAGGERIFEASDVVVVDGKRVRCAYPPKAGERPDPALCDSWPHALVLGRTRVRVTYWHYSRTIDGGDHATRVDGDVVISLRTFPSTP